jgi:ATP-dependent Clp protease adaptor protein ClpS
MGGVSTEVLPEAVEETDARLAPRWKVVLLNDDKTTFEFVTWLLIHLFRKEPEEAVRLTLEVHETGAALITVTSMERAELFVEQVRSLARPRGFPLQAVAEPE